MYKTGLLSSGSKSLQMVIDNEVIMTTWGRVYCWLYITFSKNYESHNFVLYYLLNLKPSPRRGLVEDFV